MELIDIIKSSILLFTSSIVLSVIIAFLYSKIRNQAKVEKINNNKNLARHINKSVSLQLNREKVQEKKPDFKTRNKSSSFIKNHPKFVVVNENQKADFAQNFKINYRHNEITKDGDSI